MKLSPVLIGSGRAAKAIERSLAVLNASGEGWNIAPPIYLERGQPLESVLSKAETGHRVLFIANPPGLHANALIEGEKLGFSFMVVEKPVCVSLKEIQLLRNLSTPVAVCHVYRQTWGLQTLREMIAKNELGEIIAVEGRYWQSSAAQRALGETKGGGWKNDAALSGPSDALLDVGVHWVDAAVFLLNQKPKSASIWQSYANSESPHRDTHVQLSIDFNSQSRAFASISKTLHGATNHFEINVIGTRAAATWKFQEPDQIEWGSGSSKKIIYRKDTSMGSNQGAFHGLGWLEGYVEIFRQGFRHLKGESYKAYPTLREHLDILELLLKDHKN